MKNRLLDLEAATSAIKPYLRQYLEDNGINTEKNFSCLNPKHEDKTPSMTIKQDPERAFCFSCGMVMDIFSAVHFLEDRPIRGKGFIEDNVLYLTEKYDIDIKMADLTQEEVYEFRTYNAYQLAAELVADPEFGDYSKVLPELEARKWDPKRCAEWGIGTVDFKKFRETLKKAGFEPGFLKGIDLDRSNLFDSHNLIFTVFDTDGRPVGFSARNLKYEKGDPSAGPKYNNTRVTGLECNIFKKGERLYGFDIAIDAGSPLYIFEGQSDVITARHHGHMNCVCSLGTSFTDHHISLLKRHGCFNLIFVFDSDPAGEAAIQKLMDEKLSEHKEFRVKLIQLPTGMDPDQLFREKGPGEFLRLKRWEAFEWRLNRFNDDADPEDVAAKMIPIILAEPSHIRHEKMAKALAVYTGIDVLTILSEIKRRRNIVHEELAEKKLGILNDVLWRAKKNPDDTSLLLSEAHNSIENLHRSIDGDSSGSAGMVSRILAQKEEDEKKSTDFAGFYMREDGLGNIAKRLDDDWRSNTWMCIGGDAQAGKSTLCAQMAYEIAENLANEAVTIYLSIDDAARLILFKLVGVAADNLDLTLGQIANPNYWKERMPLREAEKMLKIRDEGYRKVVKLAREQRLVLKDASDGSSLSYMRNILRYYRENMPDKNIVFFIDNFHKISDFDNLQGSDRVKKVSNYIKNLTTEYKATIVSTVEYRKSYDNAMPSNDSIADSRAIKYDASAVLHLYNDAHTQDNGVSGSRMVHEYNDELLPRVRCKFGKNKISGYEDREFFDLFPRWGYMKSVDKEAALADIEARREFLKERKKSL